MGRPRNDDRTRRITVWVENDEPDGRGQWKASSTPRAFWPKISGRAKDVGSVLAALFGRQVYGPGDVRNYLPVGCCSRHVRTFLVLDDDTFYCKGCASELEAKARRYR
jgi:hypothetical protein